jgi:hypothetical protein
MVFLPGVIDTQARRLQHVFRDLEAYGIPEVLGEQCAPCKSYTKCKYYGMWLRFFERQPGKELACVGGVHGTPCPHTVRVDITPCAQKGPKKTSTVFLCQDLIEGNKARRLRLRTASGSDWKPPSWRSMGIRGRMLYAGVRKSEKREFSAAGSISWRVHIYMPWAPPRMLALWLRDLRGY